ncbi:cytochrome c oxidase assembly factor CtaG [Rummeliibacillus sp. G93]|uniref:Cytochrome c oxidase assembly factor CtaG n=1 Tax=Rummeliibacillus stabekisii TaxID=241244 RepID=A0A143HAF4_9BACL|nr:MULTISPECIES: cytochrome c oxidase assembly factor CtaG [Rummeliibacillus]AMW98311.1 cytochrome c oxidase assembly factor CtaG [Rummeliibacillus stabekisii]MBB5169998.1 putative membrane protein [Rummeliibacillus stabekisii]UQW98271.1 cytochrome c oxidase assembly factor CtaG [Rummeliibacillus sp. G93]GEL04256.1 protein CtaG [Rummeliibacillus stabekisii]
MPLSIFGFRAMWSPGLIIVLVFLTILYFLITMKWRKDFKNSLPLKKGEAISFLIAMLLVYTVIGSPIDLMSHIMFTMHMVQMALLLLLIPIFIIMGIPNWLWKTVINLPYIKPIFHFMTKPIFAIIFFVLMFSVYHLPILFDYIKLHETLHSLYTFILFLSALFMYWPLLNTVEDEPKMKNLNKLFYIIANAVLITPACALIIFSNTPFYATYTDGAMWMKAMALCVPASTLQGLTLSGPELFTSMSSLEDQQLGGVLMKIIQEIIFAVVLGRVFITWYRDEQENADQITQDALKERQRLYGNQF